MVERERTMETADKPEQYGVKKRIYLEESLLKHYFYLGIL